MLRRVLPALFFVMLLCFSLSACFATPSQSGTGSSTPSASGGTGTATGGSPVSSVTPVGTGGPIQLAGVALSMNPNNFGAIACGTTVNIAFSAQISIAPGGSGAVSYTWNIENNAIPGSVSFSAGQTTQTVTHTLNNVSIQLTSTTAVTASIMVTSKSSAPVSANVTPTGQCHLPGPFQVVSIAMSVNPSSISNVVCGEKITVTYSATVTIAADSNAGTVSLVWSTNPGSTSASIVFVPLQITATISITLTESSSRHSSTFPRSVSISSTSPNAVTGGPIQPSGQCTIG